MPSFLDAIARRAPGFRRYAGRLLGAGLLLFLATLAGAARAEMPENNAELRQRLTEMITRHAARVGEIEQEIERVTGEIDARTRAVAALTASSKGSTDLGRLESASRDLKASASRLLALQQTLADAQRSLGLLRGRLPSSTVHRPARPGRASATAHPASAQPVVHPAEEALARARQTGLLVQGEILYEAILADALTQFPPYSVALAEPAKVVLRALADKLVAETPDAYIEVQGHTDPSGQPAENRVLSHLRAETVRDFLTGECGFSPERIVLQAYGDRVPVAENSTAEGRARNRRVNLVVMH